MIETEKQAFEAWWADPVWDDSEHDFSSRWDGEKGISAAAFYGGYHSRDEEIAALKAEIGRKDEAMETALEQARGGSVGLALDTIEQALKGGDR